LEVICVEGLQVVEAEQELLKILWISPLRPDQTVGCQVELRQAPDMIVTVEEEFLQKVIREIQLLQFSQSR
jgi:hypothetical protein